MVMSRTRTRAAIEQASALRETVSQVTHDARNTRYTAQLLRMRAKMLRDSVLARRSGTDPPGQSETLIPRLEVEA
jgi:hypothetical protein